MFINQILIKLLNLSIITASSNTKCVSLGNQKCTTQPTVNNLHPNEYTQGLRYYLFVVKLGAQSCNTLNYLSNKVFVLNNKENLNLRVFNMITGKNKSKTLTKHISCSCKCELHGRKGNSNQ